MRRGVFPILALLLASALAYADPQLPRSTDEIAALIEAAEEGASVRLEHGVYSGHLRIGKAVTLDGGGGAIIDGGGEGTVVEITAANVTLRNLTVRGSGDNVSGEPAGIRAASGPVTIENCVVEDALFGIDLRTSPDSIVRGNSVTGKDMEPGRRGDGIRLWWSHGCTIEDNVVDGSRDMVFWYSEDLVIRRNHVTNSRYGLHFMYSHNTTLTGNVLRNNSVGVYLMYSNNITLTGNTLIENRGASGYGLGLKDCDDIIVRGNSMLANRVGSYIDNSPSSVDATGLFAENIVAFNEIGILMTPNTHDNVLTGNGFVENEEQAAVHGRGELTLNQFHSDGRGNFWSDYAGFDADGDGRGDLPYEAASLFENLLAREPNLRLFVHTPAQHAVEFTARALPEIQPKPKFTDPAPLMLPPAAATASAAASHPALMALAAAGLIGAAALSLVLFAGRPGAALHSNINGAKERS